MQESLVFVGKIVELFSILGADNISCATVVCGAGGKWRGVVSKADFSVGDKCIVFLPDSQLNPEIHGYLPWMNKHQWRVKMCRFKGCPSEVLIIKCPENIKDFDIGKDVTEILQVTKYCKELPADMQGKIIGHFPSFIPKTDEPNWQSFEGQEGINLLVGKPYYITEKADGSSTTAYKYNGHFGVCSRNYELERDESIGYWQVALRYNLEKNLPDGMAIQWETVGPKIQGNPMGYSNVQGFLFSAYDIFEYRYLTFYELCNLSAELNFPMVQIRDCGHCFSTDGLEHLGEGCYNSGKLREGVVVRSTENLMGHKPVSFKVLNLEYNG